MSGFILTHAPGCLNALIASTINWTCLIWVMGHFITLNKTCQINQYLNRNASPVKHKHMETAQQHEWVTDPKTLETTCENCGSYKFECPLGVDYTDSKGKYSIEEPPCITRVKQPENG